MTDWWENFFDADYLRLWEGAEAENKTERQAAGLWTLLDLVPGSKVLDAPCGYGRISRGAFALDAGNEGVLAADQVQEDFVTHEFDHIHFAGESFQVAGRFFLSEVESFHFTGRSIYC